MSNDPMFGLDYRDSLGALARIKPADIAAFQGGKSFAIEYIGIADGQGKAALTAADAAALESAGLSIVSVYENRPANGQGSVDRLHLRSARYCKPTGTHKPQVSTMPTREEMAEHKLRNRISFARR